MTSIFRPAIDRMAGYAPGEQPQEGGWVKLNTNENPYPPSPKDFAKSRQSYLMSILTGFCRPMAATKT
jgi:histidinol-phosphate/aromatic aminotransferase/cobyric acid decarboxylase-like protein